MSEQKYKNERYLKNEYSYKGRSTEDIADEMGCSDVTVLTWLKEHNIPVRKTRGAVELQLPQWLEWAYWKKGMSQQEISDRINCCQSTVKDALKRHGIETRGFGNPGESHPNWKGGYEDYYGRNWNEQREKALENGDYECRACGISREEHIEKHNADLSVHHIIPFDDFEEPEAANDLGNLVVACKTCHRRFENVPVFPH
jgi:5-methylcytosine-specific restriction endonuclease McrA